MMTVTSLAEVFDLPSVTWEERGLLPKSPGVYFVITGDYLIYIGRTTRTLYERWRNHLSLSVMRRFGAVTIAYIEIEDLDIVKVEERRLIRLFEPALNVEFIPNAYARMGKRWPYLRADWRKNRRPRGSRNRPARPADAP